MSKAGRGELRISELSERRENIRNVAVMGHVDSGRSTLINALSGCNGALLPVNRLMSPVFNMTTMIYHEEREIPTHIAQSPDFLINLLAVSSNLDFSESPSPHLPCSDGALIVVDCVEGVGIQTEKAIRDSLAFFVRPVLVINKIDRLILELAFSREQCFETLNRCLENYNAFLSSNKEPAEVAIGCPSRTEDALEADPVAGNVAFTSVLHGWGFTIQQIARKYSRKLGIPEDKLVKRFWGDNYFDSVNKVWTTSEKSKDGRVLERSFNQFVMSPLFKIFSTAMEDKQEELDKILKVLSITLPQDERDLRGRPLLKAVMRKFLSINEALMDLIVLHLPSPVRAQKYRTEMLYQGPLDDPYAEAISRCDPSGSLMIYVPKSIHVTNRGNHMIGRIFSGRASPSQSIFFKGPNYLPPFTEDLSKHTIGSVCFPNFEQASTSVGPGNIVLISGIESLNQGHATLSDHKDSHIIFVPRKAEKAHFHTIVSPKKPSDLPALIKALSKLVGQDTYARTYSDETGRHYLASISEVHLEVLKKDFQHYYAQSIEVVFTDDAVEYRETILGESPEPFESHDPEGRASVWIKASPVDPSFAMALEEPVRKIRYSNMEASRKVLSERYGIDPADTLGLWCFGPSLEATNVLINRSERSEIAKESIIESFSWSTREGPLCGEQMHNVKFTVMDFVHAHEFNHFHRVAPTLKRCFHGSFNAAQPRLMEAFTSIEITCPVDQLHGIESVFAQHRGEMLEMKELDRLSHPAGNLYSVTYRLPLSQTKGIYQQIRASTQGQAFPRQLYDDLSWSIIDPDLEVTDPNSRAFLVIQNIRLQKGMK